MADRVSLQSIRKTTQFRGKCVRIIVFYFQIIFLTIIVMHFITNGYKRSSKTKSTDQRQRVPLREAFSSCFIFCKLLSVFNVQFVFAVRTNTRTTWFNKISETKNKIVLIKYLQSSLLRFCISVCTDVTLPRLPSTLTCDLYDRCLGVRCCVDLDLQITVLSSTVWLELDPCEFALSMGFGKWSITFTIFDYHWGEYFVAKALLLKPDQVFS